MMRRRGKFCPHIVGCRSIVGEGLHLGKVRQFKVSRDVSAMPKLVPMDKVGYEKLQLIVLVCGHVNNIYWE